MVSWIMKDSAQPCSRARLTQTEIQRVQVTVAHIDQATNIRGGSGQPVQFLSLYQPQFVFHTAIAKRFVPLVLITHLALLERDIYITMFEITVYVVFLDALLNNFMTPIAHFKKRVRGLLPPVLKQPRLARYASDQLSSIASRRPPADGVLFQHSHFVAALGLCTGT